MPSDVSEIAAVVPTHPPSRAVEEVDLATPSEPAHAAGHDHHGDTTGPPRQVLIEAAAHDDPAVDRVEGGEPTAAAGLPVVVVDRRAGFAPGRPDATRRPTPARRARTRRRRPREERQRPSRRWPRCSRGRHRPPRRDPAPSDASALTMPQDSSVLVSSSRPAHPVAAQRLRHQQPGRSLLPRP